MWFYISLMLGTAIAMEFVAYFMHKYIMHGFLWSWHFDHHNPKTKKGFWEKNDLFFLIFAVPSMIMYFVGSFVPEYRWLLFIGIGISIYGMIYFLIHDVYIHRRFKWFRQLDGKYSRAILRAHGAHHVHTGKYDGESFGLLVINPKYFKKRNRFKKSEK